MGKSTIDGKIPTTWTEVQNDLTALQTQANATQDVSAEDLKLVEQGIAQLQKSDSSTANAGNYERLIGTVQNLQGIASSTYHATDATNQNWASEMNDVTQLAAQMSASKAVATPNQKTFGTEVDAATLPGDAAKAKGTMYAIHSDPPSYAAESNGGYTVYDQSGMLTATFTKDQKPAIELGGGQVLKLSKNGFGNSWVSNTLDGYSTKERAADWTPPATSPAEAEDGTEAANGTDDTAAPSDTKTINGEAQGHGPGTAYFNMPADATPLPGELAELQKTQQVNLLKDANPPVYITSNSGSPATYSVYNEADGSKRGEDLTPPFAIGMGNGSWFAASEEGIASAWTTTDPKSLGLNTALYDLNGSGASDTTLAPFKAQSADAADKASAPSSSVGGAFEQATPEEIAKLPVEQQALAKAAGRAFTLDTTPRTILVQQKNNTSYTLFNLNDPSKPTNKKLEKEDDTHNFATLDAGRQDTIALNNGKFLRLGLTLKESQVYNSVTEVPRSNPPGYLYNYTEADLLKKADAFPTADEAAQATRKEEFKPKFLTDDQIKEDGLGKGSENSYHTQLSISIGDKKYTGLVSSKHNPSKPGDGNKVWLKSDDGHQLLSLKTSDGFDLHKGAYGSIDLENGAQYIACSTGYWLVADGQATNITSGKTVPAQEVQDALKATDNKAVKQNAKDIKDQISNG